MLFRIFINLYLNAVILTSMSSWLSSRGLWGLLVGELASLVSGSVGLARLVKAQVGQADCGVGVALFQSHHLLLDLQLELVVDRNWSLSSGLDHGLLHLAERLEVANCAHHLLGQGVDILSLLGQVDVKGLSEHLLEGDSLLEEEIKVGDLDLEIIASLSLFANGSWLVGWQLVKEPLHESRQDVLLDIAQSKLTIFVVLWVLVASGCVQDMLQSDDLYSDSVVDFLGFHLHGKVLSANDLVMLLDIDNWEVYFHHHLSEFRLGGGPMLVGELAVLDSWGVLGSLASFVRS